MKTNKLLKPNKLTLAIRAAMSPQALAGAALVVAASQADAAEINVDEACTFIRAVNAANHDSDAHSSCARESGPATKFILFSNTCIWCCRI